MRKEFSMMMATIIPSFSSTSSTSSSSSSSKTMYEYDRFAFCFLLGALLELFFLASFICWIKTIHTHKTVTSLPLQSNSKQYKAIQSNTKQYKAIQSNTKQLKTIPK
jgi:hypothetical protein